MQQGPFLRGSTRVGEPHTFELVVVAARPARCAWHRDRFLDRRRRLGRRARHADRHGVAWWRGERPSEEGEEEQDGAVSRKTCIRLQVFSELCVCNCPVVALFHSGCGRLPTCQPKNSAARGSFWPLPRALRPCLALPRNLIIPSLRSLVLAAAAIRCKVELRYSDSTLIAGPQKTQRALASRRGLASPLPAALPRR